MLLIKINVNKIKNYKFKRTIFYFWKNIVVWVENQNFFGERDRRDLTLEQWWGGTPCHFHRLPPHPGIGLFIQLLPVISLNHLLFREILIFVISAWYKDFNESRMLPMNLCTPHTTFTYRDYLRKIKVIAKRVYTWR